MPGDTKYERRLWKARLIVIGVAAAIVAVIFVARHL